MKKFILNGCWCLIGANVSALALGHINLINVIALTALFTPIAFDYLQNGGSGNPNY